MMKGQEEAPIELLIGVTILGFVLIIGNYVYQNTCATQQENKLEANFNKLGTELETVYKGSLGSANVFQLDFSQTAGCVNYEIDSIRIMKAFDTECGTVDECLVLIAYGKPLNPSDTSKGYEFLLRKVLSIDPDTKITSDFQGCEMNLNEFERIDIGTDSEDLYKACWFEPRVYDITIKKVETNEILISKK